MKIKTLHNVEQISDSESKYKPLTDLLIIILLLV